MARHAFTRGISFLLINWLLIIVALSVSAWFDKTVQTQIDMMFFVATGLAAILVSIGTCLSWYLVTRLVK